MSVSEIEETSQGLSPPILVQNVWNRAAAQASLPRPSPEAPPHDHFRHPHPYTHKNAPFNTTSPVEFFINQPNSTAPVV